MRVRPRTDSGFTVTELLLTVVVLGTIAGMALPIMSDVTASVKLNEATRTIERELQGARLKSVSTNRLLRVRTNCPSVGYFRTVEVIGSAADNAAGRCLQTTYPFPPADTELTTLPNVDGPVKTIPNGATVGSVVIEFSPDGTVTNVVSGTPQIIATPLIVTVTRSGKSKTMAVNGLGKIQLQ